VNALDAKIQLTITMSLYEQVFLFFFKKNSHLLPLEERNIKRQVKNEKNGRMVTLVFS
jgi:hypothetical protein